MSKIYIAGKITDLDPAEAYEAFLAAENLLTHLGHEPLNPMKLVDQKPGRTYGEYLADALRSVLVDADALFMLPNWGASRGARIEHYIALTLDIPVYSDIDAIPKPRKANAAT